MWVGRGAARAAWGARGERAHLALLGIEYEHLAVRILTAIVLALGERMRRAHTGAEGVLAPVADARAAGAHDAPSDERRGGRTVEGHAAFAARGGGGMAKVALCSARAGERAQASTHGARRCRSSSAHARVGSRQRVWGHARSSKGLAARACKYVCCWRQFIPASPRLCIGRTCARRAI